MTDAAPKIRVCGIGLLITTAVLSFVIILHGIGADAAGATYFVDDTGCNDGWPGSLARPWCTIQKAANVVNPGDLVLVADGVYRTDANITFQRSGTEAAPVTFRALGNQVMLTAAFPIDESGFSKTPGYNFVYEIPLSSLPSQAYFDSNTLVIQNNGESVWQGYRNDFGYPVVSRNNPGEVVDNITEVDNNLYTWYRDTSAQKLYVHTRDGSAPTAAQDWMITRSNYFKFFDFGQNVSNIVFDGFKFFGASIYYSNGGNSNIQFLNTEVMGTGWRLGTVAAVPTNGIVYKNLYIHDGLPGSGLPNSEATISKWVALAGYKTDNARLENIVIERFWHGINWSTPGNNGTLLDGAVISFFIGHPIYLGNTQNLSIKDTRVVLGGTRGGLYLHNENNLSIENSIFGIAIFASHSAYNCQPPQNTFMRNNVFNTYTKEVTGICLDFAWNNIGLNTDYNYFLPKAETAWGWLAQEGTNFEIYNGTSSDILSWRQLTGQDMNSELSDRSPLWVDWQYDDFHLVEGAELIDRGTVVDNNYDYDNVFRPQGAGYDMGPYEFNAPTSAAYYVNNAAGSGCSDSNNGTSPSTPWCTIQKAASYASLNPGDTVMIADGIYREKQISFTRSGTAGNPITFKASGSSAIITSAFPVNETLFTKTSDYNYVYEITEANLPTEVVPYDPTKDDVGVAQLDGTTTYVPPPANYQNFDKTLYQNPFQKETSIASVDSKKASWYFDTTARKLYVHTRADDTPVGHELEIMAAFSNRALTLAAGTSHITFDAVQDKGLKLRYAGLYQGLGNNSNITLKNFESIGFGVKASGNSTNTIFQDCYIHDGLGGSDAPGGWGLGVEASTGAQIINCTVEKFWNNVQAANNINTTFDRFVSRDCPNHGLELKISSNFTVTNSTFYKCQDFFYIYGGSGTAINNLTQGFGFHSDPSAGCVTPQNFYLRNNIFSHYGIGAQNGCPAFSWGDINLDSNYNLFLPRNAGEPYYDPSCLSGGQCSFGVSDTTPTLSDWRALTGQDLNSIASDGSQVWPSWQTGDFHLSTGAQAINTGATVSNDHDYDNDSRPQGAGWDIGIDEYQSGAPPNNPPVLAAIGPKTLNEGDVFSFGVTATDADAGDTVTLSASNLPSGAVFVDNGNRTGTFSWTPNPNQAGTYANVHFEVTDGTATDSEDITITVLDGLASCTPNWSCTEWSVCTDELQSRTCTDQNACGTDTGRPSQAQACDSTAPGQVTDLQAE